MTKKSDPDVRRIKLLVVDDEVDFLFTLSNRLLLRGFDVTTACDGEAAIKAAKKGKFDLTLLDLKMPGIDGTKVLDILRTRHRFLEVVILTGQGSLDSAVECTKLGAFDYLTKPCKFEDLLDVLKRAYETRLKKKFECDQKRMEEIEVLSMGSPLSVLRALAHLDDDER